MPETFAARTEFFFFIDFDALLLDFLTIFLSGQISF